MGGAAVPSTLSLSRRNHGVHGPRREGSLPGIPRFKLHHVYLATYAFDSRFLIANATLFQIFVAKLLNETPVFVKRSWPGDRFWDAQLALENERSILSSCKGPYLLNLVGVSDDTPERVLLLEHAAGGNLSDALHNEYCKPIEWPARIRIAHHVAVALQGLHRARSQIVHRDVKSSNVWIADQWSAKLGGFEFAMKFSRSSQTSSAKCPHKAMAVKDPDYQAAEHLCAKTDVFCFGVLLLEIISGRKAIDVNHHPPFVVDWALPLILQNKVNLLCDPRMRPPFQNSKAVLDMARVGMRCLNSLSSRRPTMADVAEELKMLSLKVPLFEQKSGKKVLDCKDFLKILLYYGSPMMDMRVNTPSMLQKTQKGSGRQGVSVGSGMRWNSRMLTVLNLEHFGWE
ncbi:hypothetical protein GOP47_0011595 [Adiantum capillus-veneris]|uniref:Protein kinase domain-containing protein n=1 Tax=Adiantum capillus-veneris TaxID=13818 RepID=A0A9D4ZGW9_ADICA|nr:hypothetical protein GOP47_0030698 [Adiantum capillus-veneris]KAI5073582.1 hypothetical protein GOP47_0011595 [Adiantum capillus-veneris]